MFTSSDPTKGFASSNLTMGQMNAIVKKLGGEEEALRFLRGELILTTSPFTFLTTVKLGVHKSAHDYYEALEVGGNVTAPSIKEILNKMPISETEVKLNLVTVSVRDLGFKKSTKLKEIRERGMELGYGLCPAEVGPALRLQYQDQPERERLTIAMDDLVDSEGWNLLFRVDSYRGTPILAGNWGSDSKYAYPPRHRFVFVNRK